MEVLQRIKGGLFGVAIGDALGHPTEFMSMSAIVTRYGARGIQNLEPAGRHPSGTFTDDTQMTICVARALIRAGNTDLDTTMNALRDEFVAWATSPENNRAPGGTCLRGCRALAQGAPWKSAGVSDSKGCGAAMRAAPFGLSLFDDIDGLIRFSAAQSSLTHRHPTAIASSVAAAAAVAHVLRTGRLEGIISFTRSCVARLTPAFIVEMGGDATLTESIGASEMLAALDKAEANIGIESDDVCRLLGGAWIGEEAVATALWCVLRAEGDFRQSVLRGANSSGDSDSIACIAGSIAGALCGIDGIPPEWKTGIEKPALLDKLAQGLAGAREGIVIEKLGRDFDPFLAEKTVDEHMSKDKIAKLEEEIRHHNARYWDDNAPEISDYDYDALVTELKAARPDSPVLLELGPTQRFGTGFTHKSPMLSLDKCYADEELQRWTKDFSGQVVVLPKFDGIACSLHYDASGRLRVAATRGDGVTGDDITLNARAIKDIPTQINTDCALEVRGEIYMRLSVFAKYKADGMANPRNLAAGAIKQKNHKKSADYHLSFAAYDLLGSDDKTLLACLDRLDAFGFAKVDRLTFEKDRCLEGYEYFAKQRALLDYEIDGVVFKVDSVKEQRRLGVTGHHPRYALAYKFQGDSGISTLNAIEWSVARTGAITPVAIVDPVVLSGVTVTRASLHNVAFIDRLGLTLSAKLTLVRRGGVIPNVEFVSEAGDRPVVLPSTCPSCGAATERRRDFLYCSQPQTCKAVAIGQLSHYADVTGMLGFGGSILDAAYDAGLLRDAADYYALRIDAIMRLERAGEKLATKLVAEVDKARVLSLPTFLRALGISDLGKNVSQILADRYRTLDAVRAVTGAELAATHGIGDIIAENVVRGLKDQAALIEKLAAQVQIAADGGTPVVGVLSGKSFVFTGKLVAFSRSEAEKRVRAIGAAVLGSVTKQLDYLVVGADKTGGPSTKQKAADKLISAGANIRVLEESELEAMLTVDKVALATPEKSSATGTQQLKLF